MIIELFVLIYILSHKQCQIRSSSNDGFRLREQPVSANKFIFCDRQECTNTEPSTTQNSWFLYDDPELRSFLELTRLKG
jgi:hypothetical protein